MNIKNRSGKAKVIGTVICLGGALLLTLYKGLPLVKFQDSQAINHSLEEAVTRSSSQRRERWTIGSFALLAGTLFWSSWFLLQSSIAKSYPCQYSSTAIMTFFSAIQAAILAFCTDRNLSIWIPKKKIDMLYVIYNVSIAWPS